MMNIVGSFLPIIFLFIIFLFFSICYIFFRLFLDVWHKDGYVFYMRSNGLSEWKVYMGFGRAAV